MDVGWAISEDQQGDTSSESVASERVPVGGGMWRRRGTTGGPVYWTLLRQAAPQVRVEGLDR